MDDAYLNNGKIFLQETFGPVGMVTEEATPVFLGAIIFKDVEVSFIP